MSCNKYGVSPSLMRLVILFFALVMVIISLCCCASFPDEGYYEYGKKSKTKMVIRHPTDGYILKDALVVWHKDGTDKEFIDYIHNKYSNYTDLRVIRWPGPPHRINMVVLYYELS